MYLIHYLYLQVSIHDACTLLSYMNVTFTYMCSLSLGHLGNDASNL